PLARAMLAAIRAWGGQPRFAVKTGTSDLNVVAEPWTCPLLAYGPGDAALDHTPNEHIDLTEFDRSVAILRTALAELAHTL
ncbi:MAG: M20/M25/M40 family metallo-hydrolase, partial [Chloroflexota bacterium]